MDSDITRIADALERIAAALERFWPVYVSPNFNPPYIPNYVPPFTNPTIMYTPNTGGMLTNETPMIQATRCDHLGANTCDAGAGPSEPYPTRCADPCGELHNANAYPTRPAPVDLSGESDLANYRARGCSGDPA